MLQDKFTKLWSKAVVLSKTSWPRSYLVKDEKGKILRRNTIFMKKVSSYDLDLDESDNEVIVNNELNKKEVEKVEKQKSQISTDINFKTHRRRVVKKPIRLGIN